MVDGAEETHDADGAPFKVFVTPTSGAKIPGIYLLHCSRSVLREHKQRKRNNTGIWGPATSKRTRPVRFTVRSKVGCAAASGANSCRGGDVKELSVKLGVT